MLYSPVLGATSPDVSLFIMLSSLLLFCRFLVKICKAYAPRRRGAFGAVKLLATQAVKFAYRRVKCCLRNVKCATRSFARVKGRNDFNLPTAALRKESLRFAQNNLRLLRRTKKVWWMRRENVIKDIKQPKNALAFRFICAPCTPRNNTIQLTSKSNHNNA